MQKSAKRTAQAISHNHKIGIFGDYDVDGASATALLANFFKSINVPYEIYIPDRKKEGYGPTVESFKKLINNGTKLIFTVDCGTLSFDAIDYAFNNSFSNTGIGNNHLITFNLSLDFVINYVSKL